MAPGPGLPAAKSAGPGEALAAGVHSGSALFLGPRSRSVGPAGGGTLVPCIPVSQKVFGLFSSSDILLGNGPYRHTSDSSDSESKYLLFPFGSPLAREVPLSREGVADLEVGTAGAAESARVAGPGMPWLGPVPIPTLDLPHCT